MVTLAFIPSTSKIVLVDVDDLKDKHIEIYVSDEDNKKYGIIREDYLKDAKNLISAELINSFNAETQSLASKKIFKKVV